MDVKTMPNKCCMGGCYSNYDGTNKKVTVFSFPADDELKRILWFASLPNVVKDTKSKKIYGALAG